MKVHIEENLYLESDSMQFMLTKYSTVKSGKNEGEEIAQNIGYYPSIHSALKAVMVMKIKESTATTLQELSEDIKRLENWIQEKFVVSIDQGEKVAV